MHGSFQLSSELGVFRVDYSFMSLNKIIASIFLGGIGSTTLARTPWSCM